MTLDCSDKDKFFEKLNGINKRLIEINVTSSDLYLLVKEIVHSVQQLSTILTFENATLHEEWVEVIFSLLESLLSVITNVDCPIEASLLIGTCISFLVYQIFGAGKGASLMICLLCHFSQPSDIHIGENVKTEEKNQVIDLTDLKLVFQSELKASQKDLILFGTYQNIMAKKIKVLKELKSLFVHLIILHGIIKCRKLDMFLEIVSDDRESTPLLIILFNPIYQLCVSSSYQFQAFHLLLAWIKLGNELLTRIHKDNGKLEAETKKKITIFSSHSQIVMKILDLTEANWESAIHGVPDIIRNIYKTLLDANLEECNILEIEKDDLVSELLKKTMKMNWKVKGKFIVLCSLIPHIGYKKFLETYHNVPFDLLQNMKVNYIASAIAQVYKALIADMEQNSTDVVCEWSSWWLKPISKLTLSNNRLLQQNIGNHILPWSLKTLPQSYDLLLAAVKGEKNSDLAEILLLRIAKQIGICQLQFMEIRMIREKLYHSSEHVRLEVFTLLCSSSKKSERVSIEELQLIKEFLIMNLNVDSAPFYQRLIAQMKILLIRIRDSTAAEYGLALKKKTIFPSKIIHQLEFVEWLVTIALKNTFPGACYQRRRTCLQILSTVFEVFVISPQGFKKKENPSVKTKFVIKWAQENGLWKFFGDESLLQILPCIIDFTDEIRLLATDIFQEFFPWPERINSENKGILNVETLLTHALNLCSSPHVQHCDSGALICKMIFMRYVANEGMVYSFHQQSFKSQNIEPNLAVLNFYENLVYIASFQLDRAKVELLKGASTGPIHGILLALHRCLTDDKDLLLNLYASKSYEVCLLLQKVIQLCNRIVNHMLIVLTGKSEAVYAPSFEEMSQALESLIPVEENKSEDDGCILSEEFQLLLSCCWHCIKESCFLLSDLVTPVLSFKTSQDKLIRIMLQEIADILSLVLLKCRHRGAIEACCLALTKYCREILSNKNSFNDIPKKLLNEALLTLSNAADTSVTRRSAGLPLLVQSVIAGEPLVQNRKLLTFALKKLLHVINLPLPLNYDEKTDLPQVHACHILKTLVVDSSLSLDIITWLEYIVPTCVSCFSSKSWAIRNGALQLFGATLPRLCGQKKVKEDESEHNLVSPLELFTHHHTLYTYLLQQLQCTVKHHNKKELCPELVPLLSLIVKLSPENDLQGKSWDLVSSFKPLLLDLLQSPIWNVRVLASCALSSFIHPEKISSEIIELICHLPDNAKTINCNKIHGTLLTVQKILNLRKSFVLSSQVTKALLNILYERLKWITSERHQCGIIHALYMDIICTLHSIINSHFQSSSTDENFSINPAKPGFALWKAEHLSQYLKSAELITLPSIVIQIVNHFSDDQDYMQSYLEFLNSQLFTISNATNKYDIMLFPWNNILESLINLLLNQDHPSILQQTLELIISLCTNLKTDIKFYSDSWAVQDFEKYLFKLTRKENGISVAAYALTVWSLYIREKLTNCSERIPLCIDEWISTFHGFCHPRNSENLRLQAAHSIAFAGSAIVNYFASQLEHDSATASLLMLFEGSLLLLQDEDEEIRNHAALFASKLPHSYHAATIQSSVAIIVVCQTMSDMMNSQESFLQNLWCKLQNFPSTAKILQIQKTYSKINLFEQEDINVYAEPICMIHLYSNQFKLALEKLAQENNSLWLEAIEMFADNIKNELEETKIILNCTDQYFLGAPCLKFACKPRVFLALTKLQCQTYLLCSQKSILPSTSKLIQSLEKLKEGIHDIEQLVPSLTYWIFNDY